MLRLFFYGTEAKTNFTIISNPFKAKINESCGVSDITLSKTNPLQDESKASDYSTIKGIPRLIFIGHLNSGGTY